MNSTALLSLIFGIIILLLVGGVYVGFQIKTLAAEIEIAAYKLYFELTRKDDLLPALIEKMSAYVGRESFSELIKQRAESMANSKMGVNKKAQEEKIWATFGALWQTAIAKPEVQKDVSVMALAKNMAEADVRIAENSAAYNSMVKKYNGLAGNFLLKPVSLMVRAKKAELY